MIFGCCAMLWAATAHAEWRKAESPHFVIYSDGDEATLRLYVQRLHAFDTALRVRLDRLRAPAGRPLPIYLVRDVAALQIAGPGFPETVKGFYTSGSDDVFAVAVRASGADEVLKHEYVHHFMLQHFPYAYPAWLVEGMAEYFMAGEIGRNQVTIGHPNTGRMGWLVNAGWIPLDTLLTRRPADLYKEENAVAMYYAQAWLLTHYMMSDAARMKQLTTYMQAVGEKGADPQAALAAATGVPLPELERRLRQYLKAGAVTSQAITGSGFQAPPIKITVLPPSAEEVLLAEQAVKRGPPQKLRPTYLAKARAAAAKYPGDRLAQVALARAELKLGERTAGEAVLKTLLAASPSDTEALVMLARSRMELGEAETDAARRRGLFKEAQSHAARAMNLDQDEYQTLMAWVRSRSVEPGYPREADVEAQLKALEIAPQLAGLRIETARNLLRLNKPDYARFVLTPLLNDPHAREPAAAARQLLDTVKAGQPQAPTAAPRAPGS